MSINQEELQESLYSVLGGGPASAESLDYARRVLQQERPSLDVGALEGIREQESEVMGALRQAQERIESMKGPTRAEKLLAISAGLGAPTQTGAFGETAAAVSRNLLPIAQEQRAFEEKQAAGLSDIDLAMARAGGPRTQAELDLAKLQYEQEWDERIQAMKIMAKGSSSGRGGATREAKIQDLIGGWNYSRPDAAALVDGFVDIEIVPETGRARLINKIDKSVAEVPIGSLEGYFANVPDDYEAPPGGTSEPGESDLRTVEEKSADLHASNMIKEGRTVFEMAGIGTGPVSEVLAGGSFVSSLFGGPVATETLIARQGLTMRARDLARTLIDNPRMPVRLIEMALEEAAIEPEILDTGELMQTRLVELDAYLYSKYVDARDDADDENMGEARRVNQQDNARAIGAFLRDLGVPTELQRRLKVVPKDYQDPKNFSSELPELTESPPSGVGITQKAWDVMTPQEKARAQFISEELNRGQ